MRVRGMEQELTEFAEFYESTREDCLRIVLLNVGDLHLAQDLVAEAYTRAWVSWRKWPSRPMATSRSRSAN
jgi:DNA-directed RNA polymerase specialized sigma24 family protein